jgi:hypothetical protein
MGITPALFGGAFPGAIHQDEPHGFCRCSEEMLATIPTLACSSNPQPGFMNQGGGLQSVTRSLSGHPGGGQMAQFIVDQRQQLLGGLGVSCDECVQDLSYLLRCLIHFPMTPV